MQGGESDRPWEEHRPAVERLICDVLGEAVPRAAYREYLLNVVRQWLQQDVGDPAIRALPILTCLAAGGDPRRAEPVTAAWQLARFAAKLLDDVEDGDVAGQVATAVNAGVGLLCAAQLATGKLANSGAAGRSVPRLAAALVESVMQACAGQHEDLTAQARDMNADPDTWLEIASAKSGQPLAWAAWAGALAAGADERALACYREYGCHLGILLQVADDFNGVWRPSEVSDLASGRVGLPVSYALLTADARQSKRLLALLEEAARGGRRAETQARALLTSLGAQAYLLVVARAEQRYALAALETSHALEPASQELRCLLGRVFPAAGRAGG